MTFADSLSSINGTETACFTLEPLSKVARCLPPAADAAIGVSTGLCLLLKLRVTDSCNLYEPPSFLRSQRQCGSSLCGAININMTYGGHMKLSLTILATLAALQAGPAIADTVFYNCKLGNMVANVAESTVKNLALSITDTGTGKTEDFGHHVTTSFSPLGRLLTFPENTDSNYPQVTLILPYINPSENVLEADFQVHAFKEMNDSEDALNTQQFIHFMVDCTAHLKH